MRQLAKPRKIEQLVILHDLTDVLYLPSVANEFVSQSERRTHVFGNFFAMYNMCA